MRHAHKLTKREVEKLKSEKNRGKAKEDQGKNKKRGPLDIVLYRDVPGLDDALITTYRKYTIAKDSEKYSSLVHKDV